MKLTELKDLKLGDVVRLGTETYSTRYQVFFSGGIHFTARFLDLYEALDAVIRAKAMGYKAKMMCVPS
jgi:hypothetical protein